MSPALLGLLRRACHVELASERLTQLLLLHAYIQPPSDGSSSSAAGSSASGSSGGSAVARGEALLQALMLLGHREQEGGMGAGSSGTGGAGGGLSLGQALAQRFGLGGSIEAAQLSGVLCLDEAQADYVAALLGVRSLAEAPGPPVPGGSKVNSSLAAGAGDGASASRGPDMEALKLQIQQVRSGGLWGQRGGERVKVGCWLLGWWAADCSQLLWFWQTPTQCCCFTQNQLKQEKERCEAA
jgi:hypothetical protein